MKISIITPTFNSENFISSNINSIKIQTYNNFEHIIIDNKSKDKTLEIIKNEGKNSKIISESDNGIYHAFNKGITLATGDVISIINSDDYFADDKVLENVISVFNSHDIDIVYGNIKYVKRDNTKKIVRFWRSSTYIPKMFYLGWSPPHPSFFVKKKIYEKYGNFNTTLGNASDFELMFRFLEKYRIKSYHLNDTLVIMRSGGASNKNIYQIIRQNITLLKILNINKNISMIIKFCISKFLNRIKQFINKNEQN